MRNCSIKSFEFQCRLSSKAFETLKKNDFENVPFSSKVVALYLLDLATVYFQPGLVSSAHPIHRHKPFLAWSVELYARLEDETGVVGF